MELNEAAESTPVQVDVSPAQAAPVELDRRHHVIDVLRGFALLGILMVNIEGFAILDAAMYNPMVVGGFSGAAFVTWIINYVFFEKKMMTIFSILFGAGIVLFAERVESRGSRARGLHYRRMFWLLMIGLAHAYTLWSGDILVHYAVCGMLVYPLRRRLPWLLIPLGVAIMLITIPICVFIGREIDSARAVTVDVQSRQAAGQELNAKDEEFLALWVEMQATFNPTPEQIAQQRNEYLSSYAAFWPTLATCSLMVETKSFAFYLLWRAGGLMLVGMGLLKLEILTGERSQRFYWWMAGLGLGTGLPLVAAGAVQLVAHDFDVVYYFCSGEHYNYIGSFAVGLGYIGLIIGCWKAGLARGFLNRLAAVGRMALTNYLMHSLICTALFYGWGLGWFGSLDRFQLRGVVLAIWLLQLVLSPIWLRRFRFGPVEWLWRSLTYWQRQSM